MAYTITTWHNEDAAPMPVIPRPKDTRRAVATVDEAQEYVDQIDYRYEVPESGGTIGPLPDGTVIEVEAVKWDALAGETGTPLTAMDGGGTERIIDAYNEAQEAGAVRAPASGAASPSGGGVEGCLTA